MCLKITCALFASCFAVTLIPESHVCLYIEYLFLYYFFLPLVCYIDGKEKYHKPSKLLAGVLYRLFIFITGNVVYVRDFYTVPMHYVQMFWWRKKYTVAAYAWYLCIMLTDMCLLTYCIMMFKWCVVSDHAALNSGAGVSIWPCVMRTSLALSWTWTCWRSHRN